MRNLAERVRSHYLEGMALQAVLNTKSVQCKVVPEGLQGLMELLGASQDRGFARAKKEAKANGSASEGRSRNRWPAPTPELQAARTKGWQQVKDGKRPRIKDAVGLVMKANGEDMGLDAIASALEQRKWMPVTGHPRSYVNQTLLKNPDSFERVGRGLYRLKNGYEPVPFTGKPLKSIQEALKAVPRPSHKAVVPKSMGIRKAVLMLVPKNPNFIRGSALAVKMGKTNDEVKAVLQTLEKEGIAKRNRHKDHLVWSLVK